MLHSIALFFVMVGFVFFVSSMVFRAVENDDFDDY